MTELATVQPTTLLPAAPASIVNLHSFKEVCDFAKMIADTEMVPQHFQKNPQAIVVAIQWGVEIGVPPMQALQNIAVINGRPSIWGDLGKAIVQAHPELAGYSENYNPDLKLAQVTIKRQRANGAVIEVTGDFSWQDAVDAKSWNKKKNKWESLSEKNTYQSYARDMLMWRAFWRAAKATFADALRGLSGAEESRDLERVKPAKVSGISDAAAELNESLGGKPHEQVQAEERQPGKTTPPTVSDELTGELIESTKGMFRGPDVEGAEHAGPPGPVTVNVRDKRQKDGLVLNCEVFFNRLSIHGNEPRLKAAAELLVDVPESAKTLKGLTVAALTDLEAKLREEVSDD